MRDIAEIRKLSVPDELAEELQKRLKAHRESPEDSESWDSVEQAIFGPECND